MTPESGRIGREPIAVFAERAEKESRQFEWSTGTRVSALEDGAIGLSFVDSKSPWPSVIAWHEPTAVILSLDDSSREILIECVPDDASDDHLGRLRYKYGARDCEKRRDRPSPGLVPDGHRTLRKDLRRSFSEHITGSLRFRLRGGVRSVESRHHRKARHE